MLLATANSEFPMMPVNYILADPKPQARSTNALGGEKCIENSLQRLLVHAVACVRNRKGNSAPARLPVRRFPAAGEQSSPGRLHSIDGIGYQVGEYLSYLPLKTLDRFRDPVSPFHADVCVQNATLEYRENAFDQFITQDRLGMRRLSMKS